MRPIYSFFFLLLLPLGLLATDWQAKIAPELLASLQAGQSQKLIITFVEQAEVSGAYQIRGKAAKGTYVYEQVQAVAQRTQGPVRRILTAAGREYRAFSVVNAIYSEINLITAQAIALRPEVAYLQPNPWSPLDGPVRDLSLVESREPTWGLNYIGAPSIWDMGIRGAGVVVGGQDTGYEWDNARLQPQYRGWDGTNADHNYHWHDAIREINLLNNDSIVSPENNPCGLDSPVPCDDHNHGTHTMGTMVGVEEEGDQIGVAPEAQWIGCRNMERGWGSPASYLECFNWFLAPTDLNGENPDPGLAPHVINNSWGCPTIEGCDSMNVVLLGQAVEALRAAGVFVVASAGNDGRGGCSTISNPAAIYEASFTIGAHAINDTIAAFSSRGPVTSDGSGRLKPNIVAPGVGVRSIVRNGQYRTWNGTSMAGPHVAGAVALMISANPQLAGEVDSIQLILERTATPRTGEQDCGGYSGAEVPNPIYGYGSLNALEAVNQALATEVVGTDSPLRVDIGLYPNPAKDRLIFDGITENTPLDFVLRDGLGRLVLEQQFTHFPAEVNVSRLSAGVYFYQWWSAQAKGNGKLVIE